MKMKNYQSITITNDIDDDDEDQSSNGFKTRFTSNVNCNSNSNNTNHHAHHSNNRYHNTHPQDHLVPPFDDSSSPQQKQRPSNLFVGTFNLIATIVGGAVLSLPIVFHKCGVAFTTIAMIGSAGMTYMSLIMLVYCSRRGGGSSYGEVVRSAFGEKMEEGVSILLFVFLMFVITGYQVLIRDIWTPLVREITGRSFMNMDTVEVEGDYVLLAVVVFLCPFLVQRSLHALRYNCYVGASSIFILCVALCRGGWQNYHNAISMASIDDDEEEDQFDNINGKDGVESNSFQEESSSESYDTTFQIEFFKVPSTQEILFCFPIVTLTFLCHFNIIAIQNALSKPTRQRIQNLTGYSVTACFALCYAFGLGGYLYAGSRTEGNILLNVPTGHMPGEDEGEYYLFLLGRIGCGTMIAFAMPLMTLPCREALLEVVDVLFHHSHHIRSRSSGSSSSTSGNGVNNEASCWKILHKYNKTETVQDAAITTEDEIIEILPEDVGGSPPQSPCGASVLIRHDPIQHDYIFRNTLAHYGSTLLITTTCYLGAVAVSGVAAVWSFIGSSMGVIIAFILPCGCFIVIENTVPESDRKDKWIWAAWAILLFSVVGAIACTLNNVFGFGN